MFVDTFIKRILFNFVLLIILFIFYFKLFYSIYVSDTIIFSFAVHPFNLCEKFPILWFYIKLLYIPITIISSIICINILYSFIFRYKKTKKSKKGKISSDLYIKIFNEENDYLIIPEAGLYQNFLITGTIGSGKTSSIMYPFSKQLIKYSCDNSENKLGMLILDVKGNYYSQVKKYANFYNRSDDLIVIEIRSEILNIILLINLI
ncbi:MAG: hypothetical protein HFJ54_04365 [Clostridia bacterium]|nr:hypothetical protein [Clostridia bacterium]